jgi:RNA polymerase sigma-70 factor (ECF subfamily)
MGQPAISAAVLPDPPSPVATAPKGGRRGRRGASVARRMSATESPQPVTRLMDPESRQWLRRLAAGSGEREQAAGELHAVLLRAARFEVRRRGSSLAHLAQADYEDLAQQSADDALVSIIGKLADFRGESRFTTWAYKFALYEAAAKVRRTAWRGRELPLGDEAMVQLADARADPHADAETAALLDVLSVGIERDLTDHQREVLVALALNEVPIDVLAERMSTTRGALYKTLHDARQKLRASLAASGMSPRAPQHRER